MCDIKINEALALVRNANPYNLAVKSRAIDLCSSSRAPSEQAKSASSVEVYKGVFSSAKYRAPALDRSIQASDGRRNRHVRACDMAYGCVTSCWLNTTNLDN